MPQSYNIRGHGELLNDKVRTKSYREAIQNTVRPGSVVVDIGTGVGIMAFYAAQCGARHVYAIEHDNSILVARELAQANGLGDKITFIKNISTAVSLPERADVVISEIHGSLPLYQGLVPTIVHAREHFLMPGGTLLPQREHIWASLVDSSDAYERHLGAFLHDDFGFDFTPARQLVANTIASDRIKPDELVFEPRLWTTLEYSSIQDSDVSESMEWIAERAATLHGFVMWFDSEITNDIGFSNAPDQTEVIFGRTFFPFLNPLKVTPGDKVVVKLHAKLMASSYTWTWQTSLESQDKDRSQSFKQSTFFGKPFSSNELRRQGGNHVPHLNQEGKIHQQILTAMDQGNSLKTLAGNLSSEFPEAFKDWRQALAYVGPFSIKYGK